MTPEEQMAKDVAWLEAQAIASEMAAQGTEEYAASEPCEKYPLLRERMIQHRDAARVEAETAARDAVRYRRILAALTARQEPSEDEQTEREMQEAWTRDLEEAVADATRTLQMAAGAVSEALRVLSRVGPARLPPSDVPPP